jgi:hypothetical protein
MVNAPDRDRRATTTVVAVSLAGRPCVVFERPSVSACPDREREADRPLAHSGQPALFSALGLSVALIDRSRSGRNRIDF